MKNLFVILFIFLSGVPLRALAVDGISYLNASGTLQKASGVTMIAADSDITALGDTFTSGWYLVTGSFTHTGTITISGDVNLILADGSDLIVNGTYAGINVSQGNSLMIYALSTDPSTMGSLTAIGGNGGGDVVVGGGSGITPTPGGGAGIGDNCAWGSSCGAITINGGNITAIGGRYVSTLQYIGGAGIGGAWGGTGGTITINDGMITASGNSSNLLGGARGSGAGIGGGYAGAGGNITVNGGTIIANGGVNSSGIGGGSFGAGGGNITINGGNVTANGGTQGGAGIGSGISSATDGGASSGNIIITGTANVTATGANGSMDAGGGAGIGTGGGSGGTLDTIIISTTRSVNVMGGGPGDGYNNQSGANIGYGGGVNTGKEGSVGASATMYTLTATAGAGGAISPVSAQSTKGGRVTFSITPDNGYSISSVTVDGIDQGAISNYTFSDISVKHIIAAIFMSATAIEPTADPSTIVYSQDGDVIVKSDVPIKNVAVFDVSGKNLKTVSSIKAINGFVEISGLPKQQVLIVKVASDRETVVRKLTLEN